MNCIATARAVLAPYVQLAKQITELHERIAHKLADMIERPAAAPWTSTLDTLSGIYSLRAFDNPLPQVEQDNAGPDLEAFNADVAPAISDVALLLEETHQKAAAAPIRRLLSRLCIPAERGADYSGCILSLPASAETRAAVLELDLLLESTQTTKETELAEYSLTWKDENTPLYGGKPGNIGGQPLELLKILASYHGEAVHVKAIAECICAGAESARATATIRTAFSRLRTQACDSWGWGKHVLPKQDAGGHYRLALSKSLIVEPPNYTPITKRTKARVVKPRHAITS